jgi:PAS domain S-box-containing protein
VREVSCRASCNLIEVLSRADLPLERLVEGLPVTLDQLRDPTERIDWNLFAVLCDRVENLCEGVLTLEEIGEEMLFVPSLGFLRRAGQLVVTPRQLYLIAGRMMGPALFPNVTLRMAWLPAGRLVVTQELSAGDRESRAFFRLSQANATALPRLLDLPPSKIEERSHSGRQGRLILVPPPSGTVASKLARATRTLLALGDAVRGVARQQAEFEASLEALRSSRQELRKLIERLPDGVLIHDGAVRWANAAMISLLGYEHLGEIVGKNILDFLAQDERAGVAAAIAKAGPRTLVEHLSEYRIARPDGSERRVQAGATQHLDFEGVPARLVVVRDVTEDRQLRDQLALADRMASIGTVAAGVAHEINNPLAYMQMSLELASKEVKALHDVATLSQCVRTALEGTIRVRGIVRNLRTLSRAEEDALVAVDLPALLDSTLVLASSALPAKARIVRRYGPVPAALATHGRLGQVFLNLLLNAADSIPDDTQEQHEMRLTTSTDSEGRAVVLVSDTGVGIPSDLAARVFEPFFTTKAVGKGTGLGLSICHRIVRGFGGEIAFTSAPGAGTEFRVVLPPALATEVELPKPTPDPPSRARVLVVDDEPALLRFVCRALDGVHDVVAASSGREALDVLRDDRGFDAVLADLMMANVTGMDLYEAVRAAHPGMEQRFVFMTGGAFTASGRDFLAQVPNRFLEKPFGTDELLAALGEVIPA